MLKSYESEGFEESYKRFLRGKVEDPLKHKKTGYIDPDSESVIHNDLTDFLNEQEREKKYIEEEKRYYFSPPSDAPKTQECLNIITVKSGTNRLFCLKSDQFGFSAGKSIYDKKEYFKYPLANLLYLCKDKCKDEQKQEELIDRIVEYVKNTRTIGGSFLWPKNTRTIGGSFLWQCIE